MTRSSIALALALSASACASAPPVVPPKPFTPTFEQKSSWILRLEDERTLRDPPPPPPAPAPAAAPARGQQPPVAVAPPPPPDLIRLLADSEARIRRRAALAVGRVGLAEGVEPLVRLLADQDHEVRQMAAFALGLIGDPRARDPLIAALADSSPLVKGSAAEALGLIGDSRAAQPIATLASEIIASGGVTDPPQDSMDGTRDSAAAAWRLALFALVRLKAFDALSAAVLDQSGQPRVHWWPVAYALQRLEDPRALPALLSLVKDADPYTKAFAAKGLGAMKESAAVTPLLPLVGGTDNAAIEAIRALGRLRDARAAPALLKVIQTPEAEPHLRLEAVSVIGGIGGEGVSDALISILADPSPAIRAAVLRSLALLDAESFVFILSGLDVDPEWTVRSALATVLGTLSPEAGLPRLRAMLDDPEPRVIPAVLAAIAKLHPQDAPQIMIDRLTVADPVIRAAAAHALAELKPLNVTAALTDAYRRGEGDATYIARAAALGAVTAYGAAEATPLLTAALADKEWAVRVRAAQLLKQLDPTSDAASRIRPAPAGRPMVYDAPHVINPPYSTHAYIETDRGTIQVELAVLDAPQTVENFVALARRGFFDGVAIHRVVPNFVVQSGDPRGDGEGGPGYAIRDELNERPYLRGTVGMALDWADTGGSQFFIAHSPQPHLDAKYTVFGRVIAGMEVVDRIEQWDVIRRVRIWDGTGGNVLQN